jgi:hypothetical protein
MNEPREDAQAIEGPAREHQHQREGAEENRDAEGAREEREVEAGAAQWHK